MKKLRFDSVDDLKLSIRSSMSFDEIVKMDDVRLVEAIREVKQMINVVNSNLDNVTDSLLIEGYVYELKSLHVKYDYLIRQCKERGVTADFC